jgi:hypothetical protein
MYALNLWPALLRYCDDGGIEIDIPSTVSMSFYLGGASDSFRNYGAGFLLKRGSATETQYEQYEQMPVIAARHKGLRGVLHFQIDALLRTFGHFNLRRCTADYSRALRFGRRSDNRTMQLHR